MVSFEIKFKNINELNQKLQGKDYCHMSELAREGLVHFCKLHSEIEFVEASIEGWDDYQWDYSATLIFKYIFHSETIPTLIEAHWSAMGTSDHYWNDFDIDDVEYYPACQFSNGRWSRIY